MADRLETGLGMPPPANDTREPEPQAPNEPKPTTPFCTSESELGGAAAFCTNEPERARPLNRHVRRRLEALARKAASPAAPGEPAVGALAPALRRPRDRPRRRDGLGGAAAGC
jgi:hypothetical protein